MRRLLLSCLATAAMLVPPHAQAGDAIRVVGSSTVYPFTTAVAEYFGKNSSFKTPIVESTGTGGGLKLFCDGEGENTPDVANASRAIKSSEIDLCSKNGVDGIVETKIGYDGLVFGHAQEAGSFTVSRPHLFLALAKQVPVDGKLVDNPHTTWRDIDPSLPDTPITVYGPPPTSGTRDSLVELVMIAGCKSMAHYAAMSEDDVKAACGAMREDGRFIEAGENDNLIIKKLQGNKEAIGVFGYSFLDENSDTIAPLRVDGIEPDFDTITDGRYPVARSMFLYTKKSHLDSQPGLKEFLQTYFSDEAMGDYGFLAEKGMIPLTADELEKQRTIVEQEQPLSSAAR